MQAMVGAVETLGSAMDTLLKLFDGVEPILKKRATSSRYRRTRGKGVFQPRSGAFSASGGCGECHSDRVGVVWFYPINCVCNSAVRLCPASWEPVWSLRCDMATRVCALPLQNLSLVTDCKPICCAVMHISPVREFFCGTCTSSLALCLCSCSACLLPG